MTSRLEQLCLERGVRLNGKRRLVLDVLDSAHDHPTVEDVYHRVTARDRNISMATVYRTINLLAEAGCLVRLALGDGKTRYEEAREGRHDHLIDVGTGAVVELHEAALEPLIRAAAAQRGYDLIDYRLEIFGQRGDAPRPRHGVRPHRRSLLKSFP